MKNTLLLLSAILITVLGLLIIISSNDDYIAEKLFYQATRTYEKIAVNPDVAPPKMLKLVEARLQKIVKGYPHAQSARVAHLALAEFYLNSKKYDRARSVADEIIKAYSQDKLLLSKAHFLKGVSYEQQDQWNQALKEYQILRSEYTATTLGVQIPLYIANYYKEKGKLTQADQAYGQAAAFYEKLEAENQGMILGYAAANLLLHTYMEIQDYGQAGQTLERIFDNYPNFLSLRQLLLNIDLIFVQKLNNLAKAKQMYNKIKSQTEEPQLIKVLDMQIEALEKK